ncbi:hypothetical protein M231_03525 [Tremella mesenterica]|uniref:DEK C-terminal domain-containing protein n=1 Tax=Tremella mesenterica TaxID=5217 RepID=A0A4Q1BMU6_TREME|nr:uncharacterized protein TREMEDRAFT_60020 [Tremella mesenterica DSM 1558]EIW71076.1 hypothetical protein TREMEDRAFT_60020 [Tremella mesenterica DSM 1558]RXK39168.1 hypothetical protein M231_03525 [Tremella mesenterica]
MSFSTNKIRQAALKVVQHASRPGGEMDKEEFTMSLARKRIAGELDVEEGLLREGEMKVKVKKAVEWALEQIDNTSNTTNSQIQPGPSSPDPKSKTKSYPSETKHKSTKHESKSEHKSKINRSETKRREQINSKVSRQPTKEKSSKKRRKSSPSSSQVSFGDRVDISEHETEDTNVEIQPDEKDDDSDEETSAGGKRKRGEVRQERSSEEKSEEEKIDKQADGDDVSEMSSVYDEPVRGRVSKNKGVKGKRGSTEGKKEVKRQRKDPIEELTGDERKIAELKKIVNACGVRKQWSKEFSDCPTTVKQISRLNSILSSLGMRGQPTLGKAKALKERRELAAELNDVREFEATRGLRGKSSRDKSTPKSESESEEETKEPSAMDAVMGFFDGDSESD